MTDRLFSTIFADPELKDDAAPAVSGFDYDATQSVAVTIPDTAGPWLDAKGREFPQDSTQIAKRPGGGIIQAADPITVAEFLLLEVVTGKESEASIDNTPRFLNIYPLDAASNAAVEQLDRVFSQGDRPLKGASFEATANAQSAIFNLPISEWNSLTLTMTPPNAPFTFQVIETGGSSDSFAVDIAVDGTITPNATDASEITVAALALAKRDSEWVLTFTHNHIFATAPRLRLWGNVIGAPAGLLSTQFAFDIKGAVREPLIRNTFTQFAHTIPDTANGIYEVNGDTIVDEDLAIWITANPITGWSVTGNSVTMPDWRGRYLGGSGGRGIGDEVGLLINSANKQHRHLVYTSGFGSANAFNSRTIGYSNNGGAITGSTWSEYEGGSFARPETVGIPLCVIVGRTRQYVPISEVVPV